MKSEKPSRAVPNLEFGVGMRQCSCSDTVSPMEGEWIYIPLREVDERIDFRIEILEREGEVVQIVASLYPTKSV